MAGFSKKKYFKLAKGYYGRSKNCIRLTVPRVEKSLQKAYVGRKLRPRIMRRNWIHSINSAARDLNINYSTFTCGLNRSNILLNRKILSDLAQNQPYSFKAVVDEIKIQNQILTPKRHYTIEQMVKKNLLISAKLQDAAYLNDKPAEVKVKYVKNEESS